MRCLCLFLLLALADSPPTLEKRLSPARLEDSYQIFSYLLSRESAGPFAIAHETWQFKDDFLDRWATQVSKKQLAPVREQLEDFRRQNLTPARLEDRFERPHMLVSREEIRTIVYMGLGCGSLCGHVYHHLLTKKDGRWGPDLDYKGPRPPIWLS